MRVGSPFGILAPAIRRALGIRDGEPQSVREHKLKARIGRLFTDEPTLQRVSAFVGELAGVHLSDDAYAQLRAARRDPVLMGDQMRQRVGRLARRRVPPAAAPARARGSALGRSTDGALHRLGAAQPARSAADGAGAGASRGARAVPQAVARARGVGDQAVAAGQKSGAVAGARGARRRRRAQDGRARRRRPRATRSISRSWCAPSPRPTRSRCRRRCWRWCRRASSGSRPMPRRVLRAASVFGGGGFWRGGVRLLLGRQERTQRGRRLARRAVRARADSKASRQPFSGRGGVRLPQRARTRSRLRHAHRRGSRAGTSAGGRVAGAAG